MQPIVLENSDDVISPESMSMGKTGPGACNNVTKLFKCRPFFILCCDMSPVFSVGAVSVL